MNKVELGSMYVDQITNAHINVIKKMLRGIHGHDFLYDEENSLKFHEVSR
jgi:hypothetical protein